MGCTCLQGYTIKKPNEKMLKISKVIGGHGINNFLNASVMSHGQYSSTLSWSFMTNFENKDYTNKQSKVIKFFVRALTSNVV